MTLTPSYKRARRRWIASHCNSHHTSQELYPSRGDHRFYFPRCLTKLSHPRSSRESAVRSTSPNLIAFQPLHHERDKTKHSNSGSFPPQCKVAYAFIGWIGEAFRARRENRHQKRVLTLNGVPGLSSKVAITLEPFGRKRHKNKRKW